VTRAEAAKSAAILEAEGGVPRSSPWPKPNRRNCARKGLAAPPHSKPKAEQKPPRSKPLGWPRRKPSRRKGLAEAAAIRQKAEAWKQFSDAAKLQTVLEKLPAILESSTGIFGAVAAPLGNIDKLVVIDQGNGGATSGSSGSAGWLKRVRR